MKIHIDCQDGRSLSQEETEEAFKVVIGKTRRELTPEQVTQAFEAALKRWEHPYKVLDAIP